MPQELNIEELRRLTELHKGLTPESWLMDWAAGEIDRLQAENAELRARLAAIDAVEPVIWVQECEHED